MWQVYCNDDNDVSVRDDDDDAGCFQFYLSCRDDVPRLSFI